MHCAINVLPGRCMWRRTDPPARRNSLPPVLCIGNDRLQIEQDFVEPRLEHPSDRVFRLPGIVAERAARPKLTDTQVAVGARDDLVGPPAAILAGEILVALVR